MDCKYNETNGSHVNGDLVWVYAYLTVSTGYHCVCKLIDTIKCWVLSIGLVFGRVVVSLKPN